MNNGLVGKVGVSGLIEYRDKDGNIVKTVPFNGSIPLEVEDDSDSL